MKTNKTILALLIAFTTLTATTQAQVVNYTGGRTVKETDYANITGSPFFSEKWLSGSASFSNGKINGLWLKYNIKDDELYFKNDKDEAMTFALPVESFTLTSDKTHIFRNGYPAEGGSGRSAYFEVIADGKTQFLQKKHKSIAESKEYTSGVTDKRFLDVTQYYIFTGGKLVMVKKDTKAILAAFSQKQAELSKYLQDNKLNLKNEDDIVKAITYYNTL